MMSEVMAAAREQTRKKLEPMKEVIMASVAELVKKEKSIQARRMARYEAERAAEKKKQDSKQFSAEVAYVIKRFEYNVFNLDSSNKEVADFILENKGRFFITKAGGLPQEMPGYIEVEPYMRALKFYRVEDDGRKYIGGSRKYNKWKKALEKKFGVKITIEREWAYRDRYDNDGYATYPDQIFQGVVAHVSLAK